MGEDERILSCKVLTSSNLSETWLVTTTATSFSLAIFRSIFPNFINSTARSASPFAVRVSCSARKLAATESITTSPTLNR